MKKNLNVKITPCECISVTGKKVYGYYNATLYDGAKVVDMICLVSFEDAKKWKEKMLSKED